MTEFNNSNWAKPEFASQYRDNADIYITERHKMLGMMKSFYRYFLAGRKNNILDLGCGDGITTQHLLEADSSISATLIDASDDMLIKAEERLKAFDNITYVRSSFQELINSGIPGNAYDLTVSSMAIHHLSMPEKTSLFNEIFSSLSPGGYFLNIDVIVAPTDAVEDWYMKMWEEDMEIKRNEFGIFDENTADVITRYKEAEENQPDTLDVQLNALENIGFSDTDCYYKYGIFTIYGGMKPRCHNSGICFPDR